MRTFVALRKYALTHNVLAQKIEELELVISLLKQAHLSACFFKKIKPQK